jgi:hypothetical protein
MNSSMVELRPDLQALVDERLDAIDRVLLLAGVSRGERSGIVGEVETQIFELLGRRTSGEPTREDLLAMLSQLDPPESYAPEGCDPKSLREKLAARRPREPQASKLAIGSASIGAFLVLATLSNVIVLNDELLLMFEVVAMLVVSICGGIALMRIGQSQGWLYGRPAALFAAALFPLFLCNSIAVMTLLNSEWLLMLVGFVAALGAFNAGLFYGARRVSHAWFPRRSEPVAAVR